MSTKAKVTLGRVPLSAVGGIAWKFVSGVAPYTTTFSVHKSQWPVLQTQIGKPLVLEITDSRGLKTSIYQVYILHEAPSDSPHRVSFVVADKRWLWPYKLVVRDYNVPRKTGDRTAKNSVPVETTVVIDQYDYLRYSLTGEQGVRWTAQDAVKDILDTLEGRTGYFVRDFPIKDTTGSGNWGEFTLQGVMIRDQGDVALARMLSYVPGADVFVDRNGKVVVYDTTDLDAVEKRYWQLPETTWAGEYAAMIDRKKIRPKKVVVHYQREVEMLFEYSDNYTSETRSPPVGTDAYLENVCLTVDPSTRIAEYDPDTGLPYKDVPVGTWVEFSTLLAAWDADRPSTSNIPWTFETIAQCWVIGDLEATLGARGQDVATFLNINARVDMIRQHFRQTFRVNRRYMERFRSLRPIRVGLLDPVTGARAPAGVWGQFCVIPTERGRFMARRGAVEIDATKYAVNCDYTRSSEAQVIDSPPSPAHITMLDEELGIFHVSWIRSPYGTDGAIVPCLLVEEDNPNYPATPSRDLAQQDTKPVGFEMRPENSTNGMALSPRMSMVCVMTAVPAAPNSAKQFHKVDVDMDAQVIGSVFRREYRIKDGEGPPMEVFIPPTEITARFAIEDTGDAYQSAQHLFGIVGDQTEAGIDGTEIPGYVLTNGEREIKNHSLSVAIEAMTPFADNVQGTAVTIVDKDIGLVGNMSSAAVRIGTAPSAKVDAIHVFPGQQRRIPRLAVMPEAARAVVLGIVPYRA